MSRKAKEIFLSDSEKTEEIKNLICRAKGPNRSMLDFAREIGISQSKLSRYVKGNNTKGIPLDIIKKMDRCKANPIDFKFYEEMLTLNGYALRKNEREVARKNAEFNRFTRANIISALINSSIQDSNLCVSKSLNHTDYSSPDMSYGLGNYDLIVSTKGNSQKEITFKIHLFMYSLEDFQSDNPAIILTVFDRAGRTILLDSLDSAHFDNVKNVFVFSDPEIFQMFINTFENVSVHHEMSALLVEIKDDKGLDKYYIKEHHLHGDYKKYFEQDIFTGNKENSLGYIDDLFLITGLYSI